MARTARIFCVSTARGAAMLAAALDAGLFEPSDRRLLLIADTAANPETAPSVAVVPGFARVRERFDEVRSWNETVSPFHPSGWTPRPDDVPLWERHLRLLWGLGEDEVHLAVESVHGNPSSALCQMFTGAPVDVYADDLLSYGPSPDKLDPLIGTRVGRLLHLDLVPGLAPLLLTEFGVPAVPVPWEAFLKVVGELADAEEDLPEPAERPALLLGQCGRDAEAEAEQQLRMVRGAVALGHRTLVLAPHPAAFARRFRPLEDEASRLGAELTVLERPVLAEVAFQRLRPALVVGCSSPALLTAAVLYGLPVARAGTGAALAGLTPYGNAERVPLTVVDALLPDLEDPAGAADPADPADTAGWSPPSRERVRELGALLRAVGFAMQPRIHSELREEAERYLSAHPGRHISRYFTRRRLASLALPGGLPTGLASLPRNPTVRRLARRARALRGRRFPLTRIRTRLPLQGRPPG
ncbi:polysialyltransferase family glycosyltransferase [Streptomyces sp. NPDC006172]|uniref:polysialyltransferase family glycosyltransferase n=1 Tax=Streptomyces sp. NPDC006172 TaxID=3154470 RepID=UPI0033D5DF9D